MFGLVDDVFFYLVGFLPLSDIAALIATCKRSWILFGNTRAQDKIASYRTGNDIDLWRTIGRTLNFAVDLRKLYRRTLLRQYAGDVRTLHYYVSEYYQGEFNIGRLTVTFSPVILTMRIAGVEYRLNISDQTGWEGVIKGIQEKTSIDVADRRLMIRNCENCRRHHPFVKMLVPIEFLQFPKSQRMGWPMDALYSYDHDRNKWLISLCLINSLVN